MNNARLRYRFLTAALWAGILAAGFAYPLHAQSQELTEKAVPSDQGMWKLINSGLFAVALGWFLVKYAPGFFNARSADIQKAIQDATGLKLEADYRYSAIDRQMAELPAAVDKLRAEAQGEMAREHERIEGETKEEVERIQASARAEVEALRLEGAHRVQKHTAELALGLAERRLQDQFSEGEPANSIDGFLGLVNRGRN